VTSPRSVWRLPWIGHGYILEICGGLLGIPKGRGISKAKHFNRN